MNTKQDRQTTIRQLVNAGRVATQQDLLRALRKRRMPVDQSTLSRDLAELGVRKAGGRYVAAETTVAERETIDYSAVVGTITACGPHLIVVTTQTGQAQPVAVVIDGAADPSIAGTIAGDDTIFVATKSRRTQAVALRRLEQWFGPKGQS
jgi:transcriptional regulator of arginine metabolism